MISQLVSGHVFRRRGARGDVWYAKYRLPDGRQVKRRIGPAFAPARESLIPPQTEIGDATT